MPQPAVMTFTTRIGVRWDARKQKHVRNKTDGAYRSPSVAADTLSRIEASDREIDRHVSVGASLHRVVVTGEQYCRRLAQRCSIAATAVPLDLCRAPACIGHAVESLHVPHHVNRSDNPVADRASAVPNRGRMTVVGINWHLAHMLTQALKPATYFHVGLTDQAGPVAPNAGRIIATTQAVLQVHTSLTSP